MLTLVGAASLLLILVGLFRKRLWPWIIAASAALPATMALTVGGNNGLAPFFLIALVLAALLLTKSRAGVTSSSSNSPGKTLLAVFAGWALIITLVAPTVFAGIEVLDPRGRTNTELAAPSVLEYSVSNIAQIAYLLLGLCVVFFLSRIHNLSALVPSAAFWAGNGLSLLTLISNRFGSGTLTELFSNSPTIRYINFASDGITPRFRGVFAEPSALALFSIVSLAFFLSMSTRGSHRMRLASLAGALLSSINLILGAAGTAVVGGLMVATVAIFLGITRFLMGKSRWPRPAIMTAMAAFSFAPLYAERLWSWSWNIVSEKIGSSSLDVRSASNDFSLNVLVETMGLGAGLGSNRPNDFLTMLLSNVGIPGTALFFAATIILIIETWKDPVWRPTAWALLSFLMVKCVSGANMSDPVMWVLIGVCANVASREKHTLNPGDTTASIQNRKVANQPRPPKHTPFRQLAGPASFRLEPLRDETKDDHGDR